MIVKITMQKYGWTKYGGGNHGLVKEGLDEWYCQTCGRKQVKGLPSYMLPFDSKYDRNFVRICSNCQNKLEVSKIEGFYHRLKRLLEVAKVDYR